ncbi:aminotransferase class III-fold pyridoxal phosphate-dependent enzyme [Peptostreptococcus faecalis]|uniref:aminotransferase class III-fold pyridoxal phosphate-dependent enzyme n=1 Tax=Peptostreptococcus faecalis TaxID=2045015 RepID=UPI000C7B741A|nr:aminotransferase class III-fold pyridoxal phosphate-dependent enzyme [Peptostreptococcus faecalis]
MFGTDSKKIEEKASEFIAKTQQISYAPITFERGEGSILYDIEGKEYIDFLSSACSANLGHGNKEIAEAISNQLENLTQYTYAYFNTSSPIQLAEKICSVTPGKDNKVLYSTTGSESIDAAIKLARAYTGRSKIISMSESYHGSTYGAVSVSALSLNMKRKIGPLLPEIYYFHYPNDIYDWEFCINEMKDAFEHYLPIEDVAAILIEPIAGDMGIIIPPIEWVQAIKNICEENNVLLICDEIQMALCRTGKWFSIEHFGVDADLYVMGKSLGGGLPLGAVVGRREILDSLNPPAHIFTLAANTTVCAAALKNIEILERMDANTVSKEKGEYVKSKFKNLRKKYDFIGDIRGLGLSIGVDIINPETGEKDPIATAKICYKALREGVVLIFLNKSTLRVQPPIVISEKEIDIAMDIIDKVMQEYKNGEIGDDVLEEIQGW